MSLEVSSLRAIAHPLRIRMLSLLTGTAMSAAEVARELDISQANASYHLRVLAKAGQITEVGQERIRGGVAKRYRYEHAAAGEAVRRAGTTPPIEQAQQFYEVVAAELVRRSRSFVRGRGHATDAEMWVTSDVWEQAVELVAQASTLIHDEAQPPHTEGTLRVNMTAVLFQMRDTGRRAADGQAAADSKEAETGPGGDA